MGNCCQQVSVLQSSQSKFICQFRASQIMNKKDMTKLQAQFNPYSIRIPKSVQNQQRNKIQFTF